MGNRQFMRRSETKLVHWPLMGGLLHVVQRGGDWAGCNSPPISGQYHRIAIMMVSCCAVLMWQLKG